MSPIRAVLFGVAILAATALAGAPAAAGVAPVAAPPPGLSITLGDRAAQTESGATLTYTATVTNAGAAPVKGTLDITIPSYAAYAGSVSGNAKGSQLSWPVTVGAGKSVSKRASVKVGTIPKGEVRFTSLATLYPADNSTQILVRTADPDAIRGVVDPAHSVGGPKAPGDHSTNPLVLVAIVLGVLVVAGLAILLWIRRGRGARSSGAKRDPTGHGMEGDNEQSPI